MHQKSQGWGSLGLLYQYSEGNMNMKSNKLMGVNLLQFLRRMNLANKLA
ncbi:hypothetical protein HMPREF9103_00643 [Lentilactobacillus parafarraginis F0439]|uniref:Uncharacterized protein n=1 Tax=Lentilactobacillus parafarraginis F0439 TaxID=797515 RepID=G9ZLP5_9LACO|nr:hypothetical protein HMPREF9103_00643 [Lentilactobacillus parafarraginis F0439]